MKSRKTRSLYTQVYNTARSSCFLLLHRCLYPVLFFGSPESLVCQAVSIVLIY
jgi:hypothetical protein